MKKIIGIRIFTTLAIGVLQTAPAQAVCTGSVSSSSYVVLYRETASPYNYFIAKCAQGDSNWIKLNNGNPCTQNDSGQLTENVEITGSSSSEHLVTLQLQDQEVWARQYRLGAAGQQLHTKQLGSAHRGCRDHR